MCLLYPEHRSLPVSLCSLLFFLPLLLLGSRAYETFARSPEEAHLGFGLGGVSGETLGICICSPHPTGNGLKPSSSFPCFPPLSLYLTSPLSRKLPRIIPHLSLILYLALQEKKKRVDSISSAVLDLQKNCGESRDFPYIASPHPSFPYYEHLALGRHVYGN